MLLGHVLLTGALRVGVQTPLDTNFVWKYWGPTFSTVTDAPLDMVAIRNDDSVYELSGDIDLIYGSASLMNCLKFLPYNFSMLSSIVQLENNLSSTVVGGIIFVRADSEIFSISDLRGKRVAFPQITYQVSCQAQWAAMVQAGVDLIRDTHLALITGTYVDTIMAVETGLVDAGLIRSGQLETFSSLPYTNFRVIHTLNTSYIWPTSVVPSPTSVLMANPRLQIPDRLDIMRRLLEINSSSFAAHQGNYSTWCPVQNYIPLMQDQVNLGVIKNFPANMETRCIRNSDVYDFVNCPVGTVKKVVSCGIQVPPSYRCLTNPCVKQTHLHITIIWVPVMVGGFALILLGIVSSLMLHQQRHLVQQCDKNQLYVNEEIVGESTLGPVHTATYYEIPVVVKTVRHKQDGISIQDINTQMRQALILTHKNLVPIIGTVRIDSKVLVLMPYRWSTLYDLLYNKLVPISKYQQAGIMIDVVCAMNFLHSNGVYGRRLMSAHLMVDESWNIQLGTHFFKQDLSCACAPELKARNVPTEASDVYHLGMLFYEVLYRTLPTRRLNAQDGSHLPDLRGKTDPLHNLIRSCWAVDPQQRPGMNTVEQVLRNCQCGSLADEYVQDRSKNKELLKQRLPHSVSHRIQHDQIILPTVHDRVSMLSIGLGSLAIDCSPADVLHLHSAVRSVVEDTAAKTNVVMLKTTDYSLMLVAALHMPQHDHSQRIIQAALAIQKAVKNMVIKIGKHDIVPAVRMGVHAGKVTARVLGRSPPIYCLLGRDVVTTYSLQEACEVNRMQLSYTTMQTLQNVPDDIHLQMHHITNYSPHHPLLPTVLLSSKSTNLSKSVPSGMRL